MSEQKTRLTAGRVFFIILLFMTLAGGSGYLAVKDAVAPMGDGKNEQVIQVVEGSTAEQVFDELANKDLISYTFLAKIYMKLFGSGMIYAGEYRLNDGMSLKQIVEHISNSENGQLENYTLTVLEGDWAKTIASKIEKLYPDFKAEDTLKKWNDDEYIKELAETYAFIKPENLKNKDLKVKLEGYLYPQTYFVPKNATVDDITRKLLDQFNKEVYRPLKLEFEESEFSIEEIVSLASIIQFEAGAIKDMPMISRVFLNRLEKGMKLESSATVCYALYDKFEGITQCEANPKVKSPYNTYLHEGIPIGPILNPSKDAIQAVLEPATECKNPGEEKPDKNVKDYFFFAADIYKNSNFPGAVYYTKTFEEHNQLCSELGLFQPQQ